MTTIYHSDQPNHLLGYKRFKNTSLASLYNYQPILHDAWVFLSAIQSQLESVYSNKEDLPEDFRKIFEIDIPIMIGYFKQWQLRNLHNCDCGNGSRRTRKTPCSKCFAGKTGSNLHDFIHMGNN